MTINFNKLKSLPSHIQIIIAVVPSVVLIALFFFLVYSPKNKQIAALNVRIDQLDKEIRAGEEKVRTLDALIAENALLKKRLASLKEQLPEEKEVSVLLQQVSELGLKSGLEILLWKPEARKTQPEGLYIEIPVKVSVLAEYHKLGDFYSHISRLPRLVNISGISLKTDAKRASEGSGSIAAEFTASTFASVSEPAPSAGAKVVGR